MQIYIGIDIGTSGCRAIGIDDDGNVQVEAQTAVPLPLRKGKFIEQEPDVWWQATQRVLKDISTTINPRDVRAIAVDGTSSTLVLCDDAGKPVHSAVMYNDDRGIEQAKRIRQYALKLSAALGPTSALAKLMWFEDKGIAQRAQHALHQADWIAGQLCGRFGISDVNNSLKLGYDPVINAWPDWLGKLKVPTDLLPRVVQPGHVIGTIKFELTERFNFPITTQVVSGTTDSTASFIATGAKDVGEAVTSLGSTLVLKILAEQPIFDPKYGVYSHPLYDKWLVGGASNSGGSVLTKFFDPAEIQVLSTKIHPAVHTGLNYYPLYSQGERFPINDPDMKPVLSPRPADNAQFFQGILEGIAHIEQRGYELLNQLGAPYPTKIYTTGGGAINDAWTTIRSLETDVPIVISNHTEAAYGTAVLAKMGAINVTKNLKTFQ